MGAEKMTRKTTTITRREVSAALSAVGKLTYEIGDEKCSGLSIRVRAKSATWTLRGRLGQKQSTWAIATVRQDDDPAAIRERAFEAKALLKRGIDPKERLQEQALGGAIVRHFDESLDGWTWEQARDKFLAFVQAEKAKATYDDYRKTLCGKDLEPWNGRLVKAITKKDVAALQDAIYARGVKVQATHTLRIVKAMLNWVSQRGESGLDDSPANAVRPMSIGGRKTALHVPTLEEIGKVPWLLDAAAVAPAVRLACMLVILSAQRRETVVSAKKDAFTEASGGGGLWTAPPAHMKSKREHVIPLPPLTWSIVKRLISLSRSDSPWLFPQLRVRRAGDKGDGHMSAKTINDAFAEIGVPMRPHDSRRAFATHGESLLGLKPSDTKAILDHAEGLSGDVTSTHYALHDGTHFKWGIMRAWEAFVVEQIAARKSEGQVQGLPTFLR